MRLLILALAYVGVASCEREQAAPPIVMKRVDYRGGVVRFGIPEHWTEKYDDQGGGEFWDPAGGPGTFRLHLLTVSGKPSDYAGKSAADLLRSMDRAEPVEGLPNGNAVREYSEAVREGDANLGIRYWTVCNLVPPTHHRLAVFSYTDLQSEFNKAVVQELLARLRHEIVRAEFSATLGR